MGNITSKNHKLTDKELILVADKLDNLEKYVPRHAKKSIKIDAIFKKTSKGAKKVTAEILVSVPEKELIAKSEGNDVSAAFETAENKIKTELKKYKGKAEKDRSLLHKFLRRK